MGQTNLFTGVKNMWLVVSHKQQLPALQELSVLGPEAGRSEAFLFQGSLRHRPWKSKAVPFPASWRRETEEAKVSVFHARQLQAETQKSIFPWPDFYPQAPLEHVLLL